MYQTFAALGDPTRFALVERLLNEGEMSAGHLQDGLPMSGPAVSRHLRVLREAGVVMQRVDAQRRMYSVDPRAVQAINAWTMDHRAFWESALDRLGRALDGDSDA